METVRANFAATPDGLPIAGLLFPAIVLGALAAVTDPGTAPVSIASGAPATIDLLGAPVPTIVELAPGHFLGGSGTIGSPGAIIVNQGTIEAMSGPASSTLSLTGTISGVAQVVENGLQVRALGLLEIGSHATLDLNGPVDVLQSLAFVDGTGVVRLDDAAHFQGIVTAITPGDRFVVNGGTVAGVSLDATGNFLTIFDAALKTLGTIGFATSVTPNEVAYLGNNTIGLAMACFVAGTRIATPDGEIPVETLHAGDLVLTHDGRARPVRWIGRRRLDPSRHPAPDDALPVRISAGALAYAVPKRDLRVSPEHALLLDGGLVPARLLLNGASIGQETGCRDVTYYHIELESHDVLLAEGAAAESFLDTGHRAMFENAGEPAIPHPDFPAGQAGRVVLSAAPFLEDPASVEPIWRRMADRAALLGFALPAQAALTEDAAPSLLAGGRVFQPIAQDEGRFTFALPSMSGAVRLVSRAAAPSALHPWRIERRVLGVAVQRITARRAAGVEILPADDPDLAEGWWAAENGHGMSWRWTDGDALLPLSCAAPMVLEIELAGQGLYRAA